MLTIGKTKLKLNNDVFWKYNHQKYLQKLKIFIYTSHNYAYHVSINYYLNVVWRVYLGQF